MIGVTSKNMHVIRFFLSPEYRQSWEEVNRSEPVEAFEGTTNRSSFNDSDYPFNDEYIFDRTDVRAIFITLYTIVFCCCFFGEYQ